MNPPNMAGLRSGKYPLREPGSDPGEKKLAGIGCSDLGPGDKIPGNRPVLAPLVSTTLSISAADFHIASGDLPFSIAANLAAPDSPPPLPWGLLLKVVLLFILISWLRL